MNHFEAEFEAAQALRKPSWFAALRDGFQDVPS